MSTPANPVTQSAQHQDTGGQASSGAKGNVLFAGGGTGGHIFPNLAILERLQVLRPELGGVLAVSNRPLDAQIASNHLLPYAIIPAKPMSWRAWHWPDFYVAFQNSVHLSTALLKQMNIKAVVATGGFISGPVVVAARKRGIPAALVNLDAIPGKANRWLVNKASHVFTAYESDALPGAEHIGLPLRRSALGPADKGQARKLLGMDPQRQTLLVTAGSQGAQSINRMMMELVKQNQIRRALTPGSSLAPAPGTPGSTGGVISWGGGGNSVGGGTFGGWQVLHLAGDKDVEDLTAAYALAGLPAKVLPFCDQMGLAWSAATLAISRAGANSVAEVWANAVPTIFYPYPYHKDQHQKFNAEPLTHAGMAILMLDEIEPVANARKLGPRLLSLIANETQRYQMAEQMRTTRPPDGAEIVAKWVSQNIG